MSTLRQPVRITLDLAPDLYREFKVAAAIRGEHMSVILRELIRSELKEPGKVSRSKKSKRRTRKRLAAEVADVA